jgi:hypothetical protein
VFYPKRIGTRDGGAEVLDRRLFSSYFSGTNTMANRREKWKKKKKKTKRETRKRRPKSYR